jgi:hypothetical protein
MKQDKPIIVYIFNDMQQATLAQSRLTKIGIDSFLENENPTGLNPLGGIELNILSKDIEKAKKIFTE